jgi:hypothetical protein
MSLLQSQMRYSCLCEIMPSYVQETLQNISIKEAKNSSSEQTQKGTVSTETFCR